MCARVAGEVDGEVRSILFSCRVKSPCPAHASCFIKPPSLSSLQEERGSQNGLGGTLKPIQFHSPAMCVRVHVLYNARGFYFFKEIPCIYIKNTPICSKFPLPQTTSRIFPHSTHCLQVLAVQSPEVQALVHIHETFLSLL